MSMKGVISLAAIVAFVVGLSSCTHVEVTYVAPDFRPSQLREGPVQVVENGNRTGPVAIDLANRLRSEKRPLDARINETTPLRVVAEITSDRITHDIDHDTDESTEYVYDDEGEVIDCYTVVDSYETTARTRRGLVANYRIEDSATGRALWIAQSKASSSRSRKNHSGFSFPPAPPFPEEPPLHEVAAKMNKAIAGKVDQLLKSAPPNLTIAP